MNTDGYYDREPPEADLPVDVLVCAFVADDFERVYRNSRGGYNLGHLLNCPSRRWELPAIASATTCGEGTCDIDPTVTAHLACDCHGGHAVTHEVSAPTMAELLDRIHRFSLALAARVDDFIANGIPKSND